MIMSENRRILVISDMHFPYNHPDTVAFLKACKNKFKPDRVISVGDEIDGHSMSFHEHDPDLLSPGDELKLAISRLQPIYSLFPKMDIVESNHGSLVYRRGKAFGMPRSVFRSYREVIEAPKSWKWHNHLTIKMSNGMSLYICHSKGADALRCSQAMGMSYVSGHHHEKFEVRYWGNSVGLYFAMIVGCLIDDDALAFSYNKTNLKRPVIGVGVILDGIPQLIPMVLNKSGRWVGRL